MNLPRLLDQALDTVLVISGAAAGAIFVVDETAGEVVLAAHRGASPDPLYEATRFRLGEGVPGRVALFGTPLTTTDFTDDLRLARWATEAGVGSLVCVPLRAMDRVVGALGVAAIGARPWSDAHVQLIRCMGDQLGVIIANARIRDEASFERQRTEAMAVIARATSTLELQQVLRLALDKVMETLLVPAGAIYLWDELAGVMRLAAHRGLSAAFVAGADAIRPGEDVVGQVLSSGVPELIDDVATSPLVVRPVVREEGIRSMLVIPLQAKGRVIGAMALATRLLRYFTLDQTALLVAVGHGIALAIENARLLLRLCRAKREWEVTFDSVDSIIVILGTDGRVVRLNRTAKDLLGGSYREILAQSVETLGPGKLWAKAAELWGHVRRTRASASGQTHDDASGKTWDITGNLLVESGLEEDRIILLARDITRVVELQASLHRSETMAAIGALVAGVCHEVRNPLFGISGTLDAFEARFGSREEYAEYLVILRKELSRMSDLMRDLLDYSRPPSQAFSTDSIENVMAQAVHACELLAKRSQVKISKKLKRGLPPILMERRRLLQVFQNLIANAIQHSPRREAVTVATQVVADEGRSWIECAVLDEGPGFRHEDLPRIFEPFYSKRRGGTGLGLSIVQRIVEEHRGKITAGNRPEGGAIVTVRFPCALRQCLGEGAGGPGGDAQNPDR